LTYPKERSTETESRAAGSPKRSALLARVAASLVLVVYVAGLSMNAWLERRIGLQGESSMEDIVLFVGFGMFAVVGALLVAKRPDNRIGWIMGAAALIVGIFPASETYAAYVMTTSGRPDVFAILGVWANGWYWYLLLALVFIYLPLLFPDGRLLSRRWLPVAVLPAVGIAGAMVLGTLVETFRGQTFDYRIENPIGIEGLAHVEVLPIFIVFGGFYAIGAVGAIASLAMRFRRSRGTERQQLKWFLFAAAPTLTILLEFYLPEFILSLAFAWLLLGLPAAIGIAVLKYRLYNIDVIINRTLVYGLLTAALVAIYLGVVVGMQTLLRTLTGQTEQPQLAVVASTLVIAALFSPLRRRIQGFINRRFYRRKYDAAKTLETFGARLRSETDLNELNGDLLSVVKETMQPAHASLWLRPVDGDRRERGG
jgi:hypothetical protein